jgi:AcrR family transcriptional regulator
MGIPERKERENEHRKEEILKAAQEVFFEKGLQSSTMDEIAEKAELSKGTLYLYFKSKEDLYLAVLIEGMGILYRMFDDAIRQSASPAEAIEQLGLTYHRFYLEQRNYFRMFHFFQSPQFHKQVSEEMMAACTLQNQKVWDLAMRVIERGRREGVFRTDLHPAEMAVILWSAMHALMMRMDYQGEQWKRTMNIDLEQVLHTSNRIILEAMMRLPRHSPADPRSTGQEH